MFSIRVVTTLHEFEALAERWNCLLRRTAADNIFLTWEWLYTWARHYLGAHRLWIILVYNNRDELVGIAPFYIEELTRFGLLRCREVRFLGTRGVSSSYLDFIIPEKHKKTVLPLIYQFLHGEGRDLWDTLTLSEIPAASSTLNLWQGLVQDAGKALDIVGRTVCPVINLPTDVEEFKRSISGNQRYNLKRKRKRLEQAGHVAYERICATKDT
ncbi:MAG: GNAT family N-acetyltransferase, partial [Nitrososphaera sp.]